MAKRRVAQEPDNPAPADQPPPARNTRSQLNALRGPATPGSSRSVGALTEPVPPARNTRSQSNGLARDETSGETLSQTLQHNPNNIAKLAAAAARNNTTPSSPSLSVPLTKTGPPRGQKRDRRKTKPPAAPQGISVSDNSDERRRLVTFHFNSNFFHLPWFCKYLGLDSASFQVQSCLFDFASECDGFFA
jgi:hypothetical protein